ncbi:MAG: hypothetical protein JSS90_11370 [Bacteroidetes bacterium]|nr:hypothetical protein [Bacteroidota bacterium]
MLKKVFRFTFSLFLALAVLVSANEITFFKMVCLQKNKTVVTLESFKNCCPSKNKSEFKRKCCELSTATIKANQLTHENHKITLTPFSFFLPAFSSFPVNDIATAFTEQHNYIPPLTRAGENLLILISKFSI